MKVRVDTPLDAGADAHGATNELSPTHDGAQESVIYEQDLVDYLLQNPSFFERNATALAQIRLISPHGKRAVSLQERQAEILRERIKQLEQQLMQLIRNGNENGVIAERLLNWAEDLMGLASLAEKEAQIANLIAQRFAVPQAALKLWKTQEPQKTPTVDGGASFQADAELQNWVNALVEPYCGDCPAGLHLQDLLGKPDAVACVAVLPLRPPVAAQPSGSMRPSPTLGALVFASPDPQRFHSGMATDFLQRIAAIAAAALQH